MVNSLSGEDLEIAYDIVTNDKFSGTFDELKTKIEEAKALGASGIDIYANTKFDAISAADETENAGDDYVKAKKYLEEAKEMYDNNLIGTDDFKSRAAYFSPTGSDDPANFIENYEKAAKYLTDDSSGVESFLEDLQSKGYATFETLDDGTKQWSYDINDLEDAANNMGMGFDFFMDMFGRLEDYGFHNNFVGSVEQGAERITDLTSQLVEEQAKLNEMEQTGMYTTTDENGNTVQTVANQTALDAQREKVNLLKQDILETQQAMDTLTARSAEDYNDQIESAKQSISSMAEERQRILDENTFGENTQAVADKMQEQIEAWASEYHLELDADLNVNVNDSSSENGLSSNEEAHQETILLHKKYVDDTESSSSEDSTETVTQTVERVIGEPDPSSHVDPQTQIISRKVVEGTSNVSDATKDVESSSAKKIVDVDADTSDANNKINKLQNEDIDDKSFEVAANDNASPTISQIASQLNSLHDRNITITTNHVSKSSGGSTQEFTGTMLSPAHASGTAYNMLNLKPAYADGKVSLSQDEQALVNELGM